MSYSEFCTCDSSPLCPATTGVYIFPTVLPFPDRNINAILRYVASSDRLPSLRSVPLKHLRVFARLSARCLLSLTSILLPGCTAVGKPTHPLKDIGGFRF